MLSVWPRHAEIACHLARAASERPLIAGGTGPLAWESRAGIPEMRALRLGGASQPTSFFSEADLVEPLRVPPPKKGVLRAPAPGSIAMPAPPAVLPGEALAATVGLTLGSAGIAWLAPPRLPAPPTRRRLEDFRKVAVAILLPEGLRVERRARFVLDATLAAAAAPRLRDNPDARALRAAAISLRVPAAAGIGPTGFRGPAGTVLFTAGLADCTNPGAANVCVRGSSAGAREFAAIGPAIGGLAALAAARTLRIGSAMPVGSAPVRAPHPSASTTVPLTPPPAAIAAVAAPAVVAILAGARPVAIRATTPPGARALRGVPPPGFEDAFNEPRAVSIRSAAPGTVWPPESAGRLLRTAPPGVKPGMPGTPAGAAATATAFDAPVPRLLGNQVAACALAQAPLFPSERPGVKLRPGLDKPVEAIPPKHRISARPSRLPVFRIGRRRAAMPAEDFCIAAPADNDRDYEDWRTIHKAAGFEATLPAPYIPSAGGLPHVRVPECAPPAATPPPAPPLSLAPRGLAGPDKFPQEVSLPGRGFIAPAVEDFSIYASQSRSWDLKDAWKNASRLFR